MGYKQPATNHLVLDYYGETLQFTEANSKSDFEILQPQTGGRMRLLYHLLISTPFGSL